MRPRLLTTTALSAVIVAVMAALGIGFFWMGNAPETEANPEAINSQKDSSLPEHPLESMGIAKLTESQGIPENAITEEEAINLVVDATWGPYKGEYVDKHPAWAISATYDAEANTMGPAADKLSVWVVVLDGWGRSASTCSIIGPGGNPNNPRVGDDCITVKVSAYIILDAVTGQEMASWHFGKPE